MKKNKGNALIIIAIVVVVIIILGIIMGVILGSIGVLVAHVIRKSGPK